VHYADRDTTQEPLLGAVGARLAPGRHGSPPTAPAASDARTAPELPTRPQTPPTVGTFTRHPPRKAGATAGAHCAPPRTRARCWEGGTEIKAVGPAYATGSSCPSSPRSTSLRMDSPRCSASATVGSMPSSETNASRCGATRAGEAWAAESATPTDRGEIGEVQLPHLAGSVRAAAPPPQSPIGASVIRPATPAAPRRPERACVARPGQARIHAQAVVGGRSRGLGSLAPACDTAGCLT
jgi:hypothetical protein